MTALTREKWTEQAALIDNLWPATDFDEAIAAAYWTVLASFSEEQVQAAILAHTTKDTPFAPSIGELVSQIRRTEALRIPAWTDVAHWIWDDVAKSVPMDRHQAAVDWLMTRDHTLLTAQWVDHKGWERLMREPINGPAGGAILAKLEREFMQFAESRVDAEQQDFQRQLTLAAQRRGSLDRLDPARAIVAPGLAGQLEGERWSEEHATAREAAVAGDGIAQEALDAAPSE